MRSPRMSSEEYDYEKIEKKSKEFLKKVMGKEKFDKLQKDGKIEIEVVNKLNGNTIYELYSNGQIINKTKNQSYCVVTDRSDYPTDDMVAIKYAWLVHGNDIAEKVANKTNLYTGITNRTNGAPMSIGYGDFIRDMEQRGWNRQQVNITATNGDINVINGAPWYGDYVDYMSGRGWHRELTVFDQNNTNIVTTWNISKDTTGTAVDVRCPAGMKISIMGTQQIPRGADARAAYSLGLYVTDDNGEEIPDDTNIRITKVKPSENVIQLARVFYRDIKMTQDGETSYRFRHGIEMNGEEHLKIYILNAQNNISTENIKFKMEADLWAMN